MTIASPKAITFDYFGTLVDVDRGGIAGMGTVLQRLGRTDADAPALYADWDQRAVQTYRGGAYRRYREVSAHALRACLDAAGLAPDLAQTDELVEMLLAGLVERSPPHPEVPDLIVRLAARYPVMPMTNMDSDLFARSQLTAHFPQVTTAEMAQAYKPSERIFRLALDRLGLHAADVLHVSLAAWADIDGAKPLGMRVAWINRGADRLSPWQPRPDYEFPDLTGLASIVAL